MLKILLIAGALVALAMPSFAADCGKAFFGWTLNSGAKIGGTSQNEGKWCKNPHDSGGETYKGVARNYNKRWRGWYIIDSVKANIGGMPDYGAKGYWAQVKRLNRILDGHTKLQQYVIRRYHDNEWAEMRGDELLSQYLAYKVFDVGVNCGAGSSALCLVSTINKMNGMTTDFARKPVVTRAMVQWINANTVTFESRKAFIREFKDQVDIHYDKIIAHNPALTCWHEVWKNRLYIDE
jgi:lysozyme family protein